MNKPHVVKMAKSANAQFCIKPLECSPRPKRVKTIVNKTWHFLISEHTKNQYNQQNAMTYWQTHENQWNKTTQKETPA